MKSYTFTVIAFIVLFKIIIVLFKIIMAIISKDLWIIK